MKSFASQTTLQNTHRLMHAICAVLLMAGSASNPSIASANQSCSVVSANTVRYEATGDNFPNPDRGALILYQPIGSNGRVENRDPLSTESVMDYFKRERVRTGATTVRVVYTLADWKEVDIPAAFLDRLQIDFDAARNNGFKIIPYFTYAWVQDLDQSAARDAGADWIVRHLDQLKPTLARNQDVMPLMIAGFIGAWGEWHSSFSGNVDANGDVNSNTRKIFAALMRAVPAQRSVALRTASSKRQLVGEAALTSDEAFTGTDRARTGFHDESFLQNKWGTEVNFDWYDAYVRAESKYGASIAMFDTNTVREGTTITCANLYKELSRRGIDFMNDTIGLDRIEAGCDSEARNRLGYRYRLTETTMPTSARAGERVSFDIKIVNDGWSPVFNARPVRLVLREQTTGKTTSLAMDADPRRWNPGEEAVLNSALNLPADLPAGSYDVLLHMPDAVATISARPEYAIRLANKNMWEGSTGFNKLAQTLVIQP